MWGRICCSQCFTCSYLRVSLVFKLIKCPNKQSYMWPAGGSLEPCCRPAVVCRRKSLQTPHTVGPSPSHHAEGLTAPHRSTAGTTGAFCFPLCWSWQLPAAASFSSSQQCGACASPAGWCLSYSRSTEDQSQLSWAPITAQLMTSLPVYSQTPTGRQRSSGSSVSDLFFLSLNCTPSTCLLPPCGVMWLLHRTLFITNLKLALKNVFWQRLKLKVQSSFFQFVQDVNFC